jgi:hypothetical protein
MKCIREQKWKVKSSECLYSQLEKAVGYEQRRAIRAQIRVVRRLIAEQSTVTDKSKVKPEFSSDSAFEQFSAGSKQEPTYDRDFRKKADTEIHSKMSPTCQKPFTDQKPDIEDSLPSDRQVNDVENYQKPSSSPQRSHVETKQLTESPVVQDSKPYDSIPKSHSVFPSDSKPMPEKTIDWKSGPVRKQSKTELNIELRPATASAGECQTPCTLLCRISFWFVVYRNFVP